VLLYNFFTILVPINRPQDAYLVFLILIPQPPPNMTYDDMWVLYTA